MSEPMKKHLYVLYDARAKDGDVDDASIYCTAESLNAARRDKANMFPDAVIYKYEESGQQLLNGERVYD